MFLRFAHWGDIVNVKMGVSDLDRQIEQLMRCEIISEKEVKDLCSKAREILMEESNVQKVDSPVTVCLFFFTLLFLLYEMKSNKNNRYVVIFMDNFMI
jgi:uncharacterized membrane protein